MGDGYLGEIPLHRKTRRVKPPIYEEHFLWLTALGQREGPSQSAFAVPLARAPVPSANPTCPATLCAGTSWPMTSKIEDCKTALG
jgi:hypothetical protein